MTKVTRDLDLYIRDVEEMERLREENEKLRKLLDWVVDRLDEKPE